MAMVTLTHSAAIELLGLSDVIQHRVDVIRRRLARWLEVSGAKALRGELKDNWRIRTGDDRVVFALAPTGKWLRSGRSVTAETCMSEISYKTMTFEGEPYVLVPRGEYLRLIAGDEAPLFPKPDANGEYPATEMIRVVMATSVIGRRKLHGLTRTMLAKLLGIRLSTLESIEAAEAKPSAAMAKKLQDTFEALDRKSASAKRPAKRVTRAS